MVDANLLVTYDPSHGGKAKEEAETLLKEVKAGAKFLKSDVAGLFQLRVKGPKAIVKKLVKMCKSKPDKFKFTFHYIPIDKWVKSDVKAMTTVTKSLGAKIKAKEKWKMNFSKRHYEGDSRELIVKLTAPIDRPNVDLSNPDKIVQVEIVGKKAGLSLLDKDELLEVTKLKG